MGSEGRLLIVDANVLIDYALADVTVLALATRFIGTLHIPRSILEEVNQLTDAACDRLGLRIVDASQDQFLEAGSSGGRLSFNDRICLILARDLGWTCVTNDRALRRACEEISVPVLWGLELMVELVAQGQLTAEAAFQMARTIQLGNPKHITAEILERFERKVTTAQ